MPPRRSRRLETAPLPQDSADAPPEAKRRIVTIDCLPDAVLLHVLSSIRPVETDYLRETLPLVCKRWKQVLNTPSAIWEDFMLDFCSKSAPHQRILRTAVEKWLVPRGSHIKHICLRNSSADMTHSFSRDASCLHKIFTVTSKSLTSLTVENCNDIFGGPAFEHLGMLSQLVKLHVSSVRTKLHSDSLSSLGSLRQLKDLKIVADNDFETVLSSDVISRFPDALLKLTALTSISLSSKGITELPAAITGLSSLRQLTLDGCKNLKTLPDRFHALKSLKTLSLNTTSGIVLLDCMKHLSLEKLSMRKSNVNRMAVGLANCTIQHLDVAENAFFSSNAGEVIASYQTLFLQNLNLNDCELDKIPEALSGLVSLKVLQLANNGLMDIPAALSGLTNLECLNLEGNCFPQLPEVLPKLKMLSCLSLVACNYLEVQWDMMVLFAKWPKLRSIWMWYPHRL